MSAAAAAAARLRMLREEEEAMTSYSPDDLLHHEFKILRANTAAFRNPQTLQQVCQEEALSGWSLVEKFDDYRLRFKRPLAARNNPAPPGVDPYRTTYGIGQGAIVAMVLAAIGAFVLLLFLIMVAAHH
jgi:hypothetical protein